MKLVKVSELGEKDVVAQAAMDDYGEEVSWEFPVWNLYCLGDLECESPGMVWGVPVGADGRDMRPQFQTEWAPEGRVILLGKHADLERVAASNLKAGDYAAVRVAEINADVPAFTLCHVFSHRGKLAFQVLRADLEPSATTLYEVPRRVIRLPR